MWIFKHRIHRLTLLAAAAVGCAACGMAEGDEDERNRTKYLTFDDEAFATYCLTHYDLNGDGRLSRYEAQRVLEIDCSGLGIRTLGVMEEFENLERLNCSGNELTRLDVEGCRALEELNTARNPLAQLSIGGLHLLQRIDCSENRLTNLDLRSTANLLRLVACDNRFEVLDLSLCSASLQADVRLNPQLQTVYYRAGQQVDCGAPTELVER